jgi:AhpD family alkylhydroperoxidase
MKSYDWNRYCTQLLAGVRDFRRITLAAVNAATAFGASREPGERSPLDAKTQELIALAAAASLQSERYIALHAANARKLGADPDEIGQALRIAATVNAEAALAHSMRAIYASDRR